MTDSLSDKMRALAASHPCGAELKANADEFDEKTKAHYSAGANRETAKRMLGAWARARRLWSECTGEPLI